MVGPPREAARTALGEGFREFDGRVAEDGHPYGDVVGNQVQHSYVRREGIGRGTVRVPLPIQSFAAERRADVVWPLLVVAEVAIPRRHASVTAQSRTSLLLSPPNYRSAGAPRRAVVFKRWGPGEGKSKSLPWFIFLFCFFSPFGNPKGEKKIPLRPIRADTL